MPVTAPSRPPAPERPRTPDPLEALIKEARLRTRRRRLLCAAAALAAAAGLVSLFGGHGGGESPPVGSEPPRPVPARAPVPAASLNGALTIINLEQSQGISSIGSRGRLASIFDCSATPGCLELQSIAWSPDGRELAFSVTGVALSSDYSGVHVYTPATQVDRQISHADGFSLRWSPDGSRLAYVASSWFPLPWGTIYVMNADGSHRRAVETGTTGADMSPSWSHDGRQLLFATNPRPLISPLRDSLVSLIDVDGSHRRLVARHALWPSLSPDGTRIAYAARCGGIKLMTAKGTDASPAVPALGCGPSATRGVPVWSPDGQKLAVESRRGLFVVDLRRGHRFAKLMTGITGRSSGRGMFGTATPTWRPIAPKGPA